MDEMKRGKLILEKQEELDKEELLENMIGERMDGLDLFVTIGKMKILEQFFFNDAQKTLIPLVFLERAKKDFEEEKY